MNFYDLLKLQTENFPEKIFLRVDEQIFSYKNFFDTLENDSDIKFIAQARKFFISQKNNRSNLFKVHTSGSTNAPKNLIRSFESWNDFFPTQNKIFRINNSSKLFLHGDLNFTGNLNAFMSVLNAGGTIITSDKFAPKHWISLIKCATNVYLVPSKLILLSKGEPINNICSIFTGSQVLSENQSLALIKKFPAAEIFLYYGASELNYITYKKISAENAFDVQNLGKTFDGVKIFIKDGLIYVDTPFHVENFKNPGTVGDAGFINENGELIFLGRGDDFINRGGIKVFASEIEQKLMNLYGIEAVAVVKIVDKTRGENFLAYIVGKIDKKIIRQALLPAEMPKEIIFVENLPLNASGKIDKRKLSS